jgi:hypothetical protein
MPEHPRERVAAEVRRRGEGAVVAGCAALAAGGEADDDLVVVLGGPHAVLVLDGADRDDWRAVWGARGLLYAWDESRRAEVVSALRAATRDEWWRVREMACKVVARRRLYELAGDVVALRADGTPRVRAAAERACVVLAGPGRTKSWA